MTDPVEKPKRLYRKAARGKDEESMAIVFGGVMLVVTLAVAILLTITFLVYFLA
jgi:hypothetical protein